MYDATRTSRLSHLRPECGPHRDMRGKFGAGLQTNPPSSEARRRARHSGRGRCCVRFLARLPRHQWKRARQDEHRACLPQGLEYRGPKAEETSQSGCDVWPQAAQLCCAQVPRLSAGHGDAIYRSCAEQGCGFFGLSGPPDDLGFVLLCWRSELISPHLLKSWAIHSERIPGSGQMRHNLVRV